MTLEDNVDKDLEDKAVKTITAAVAATADTHFERYFAGPLKRIASAKERIGEALVDMLNAESESCACLCEFEAHHTNDPAARAAYLRAAELIREPIAMRKGVGL